MSTAALMRMVQQNDDKHEEAHKRLRDDIRSLERRLVSLDTTQIANTLHFSDVNLKLKHLDERKPDALNLQFSTRTLVAVAGVVAGLAVG